ncbi:MAG TPA: phosphatase PAP2 family protein [Thermoanaerobaculia bacterium]|nr:phosphatase PAP2 family protein [Thermoanaerobaculia bacterium]
MIALAFLALFLILWGIVSAALTPLRHAVSFAANRTARFRYRDYLPVATLVVIGGIVALWAGEEFLDLAEAVHAKNATLQHVDTLVHDWAVAERSSGATPFFVTMSFIGSPAVLACVLVLVAAVLLVKKRYRWLIYLAGTTGLGSLLNMTLKAFFARARPDLAAQLRHAHGYSFPSGHAMGSTIVVGALTYLVFRVLTQWRWKSLALAMGVTLIFAISSSRIYLGVHWISDVGAGITAGFIWVIATTVAYETSRRIRLIRALRKQAQS